MSMSEVRDPERARERSASRAVLEPLLNDFVKQIGFLIHDSIGPEWITGIARLIKTCDDIITRRAAEEQKRSGSRTTAPSLVRRSSRSDRGKEK
jgi:hypothetical protein